MDGKREVKVTKPLINPLTTEIKSLCTMLAVEIFYWGF
jgi:hypothetical protein